MDMFVLRSLEEMLFMCGDTEIHTCNCTPGREYSPKTSSFSSSAPC